MNTPETPTPPAPDLDRLPGLPRDEGGPVFAEPWQAQAFAMTLALYQRGVFSWGQWAEALGEEIRRARAAGDPDLGDTYYLHWLAALEGLVQRQGVASAQELARTRQAWADAAMRTPHGRPIEL